ncbi:uncharacterized protein LTR77_004342 [Saxophila tyrrhenica]|uniref:Zn(2)-C6 fungal-type domain-containing protein n=1 Tax=Saxophila tyrrhenica TaxID=1690608 RepID=A0AAV9PDK2_9PEZI|nr:hypothetical protein LTR77_004342 [Saxophila tyrrhenica]
MSVSSGTKRVKSGCITCRIRRVKCDEEKPACRRCISTGRTCDGYSTLPFSRRDLQTASLLGSRQSSACGEDYRPVGPLPRLVTDPAFSGLLEKRYFQFFRQRTVASTNAIVSCRFWDRIVLQACHTEPAVKHAVLALSSLHSVRTLASDGNSHIQHRQYADTQHQKALKEARAFIASAGSEDIDRVLVTCIIFIIFESVRGEYCAASTHMDSGRAIIADNLQRLKHTSRRRDLLEIESAFARLDLPATCFSDRTSPYRYGLQDFLNTKPALEPECFQDINEAQNSMIDLMRWLMILGNHIERAVRRNDVQAIARYSAEKTRCTVTIKQWHWHFEVLASESDLSSSLTVINLRLWYAFAQLAIQAYGHGPQKQHDGLLHHGKEILRYGEQLAKSLAQSEVAAQPSSFSFDFGYIIPVYAAATVCRDPLLRRRAISILHTYPRQEGVWESTAAAAVAARWVMVEEAGLVVTCADDVPEHRRIRYISTKVNIDGKSAWINLAPRPPGVPVDVTATWWPGCSTADELLKQNTLN